MLARCLDNLQRLFDWVAVRRVEATGLAIANQRFKLIKGIQVAGKVSVGVKDNRGPVAEQHIAREKSLLSAKQQPHRIG